MTPEQRKLYISDVLKHKGLYVPEATLTHEQYIMQHAKKTWDQVLRNNAVPLLRSLTLPSQYNASGTQRLLLDAFKHKFNSWSKDELVFLVAVMHTEELEKQCAAEAAAGNIGAFHNKPL